tara:strand:- start:2788 stop:3696 length:909 start_codon:yes stop_codon:yes gene_type:complete
MNKKNGLILVFLTAIISGFSIFINKFGVSGIDSSVFTFSKNIVVALFLFSVVLLIGEFKVLKNLTKKQWLNLGLIGLIGGAIPFLLFFKGLQLGSVVGGAFIHKTLFIYASLFALLFLKEKLNWKIIVVAGLLLIGNLLLLKIKAFSFGFGEGLVLIATLFWAGENVLSKHVLKELSGNVVSFGRMFFGSVFILIFLMFTGKLNLVYSLSLSQISWIIITSVMLLLFVMTYYNGLKFVKVSTATSILLLGSPITTLLSFVFAGSNLVLSQVLGILLILVGILVSVFFVEFTDSKLQLHSHNV